MEARNGVVFQVTLYHRNCEMESVLSITPAIAISSPTRNRSRIVSIDALRGFVILLMLVDHAREFFFLHAQVSDPMDVATTDPALFFTRLAAHLCAPVFIALTGLAAYLYGNAKGGPSHASEFLLKRGLFLIALEWTVINFAWTFDLTPATVFLQVIWVIGLSMVALALLLHLPRRWLIAVGLAIVLGHNLLDPIAVAPGDWGYTAWTILHDRGYLDLPWGGRARTSYPLLPWIGVIALGYAIGPWFAAGDSVDRTRRLVLLGALSIGIFGLLRAANIYGDPLAWTVQSTSIQTVMSFLNLTKYPPSADFLLLTLGVGAWILAVFERMPGQATRWLVIFGSAPLFFYMLHLYCLHILNRMAALVWPTSDSGLVSVPTIGAIWLLAATVAIPCWFACRWFARRKRASDRWWMRYL